MHVIERVAMASPMLVICVVTGSCASSPARTRSITVAEAHGGHGLRVEVSRSLARDVLKSAIGSEPSCGGEVGDEFGQVLRTLDRRGPGARTVIRDDDGVLVARRTRSMLELELRGRDGVEIDAALPWALAECMLGRPTTLGTDVADVRLTIRGEGGGSFELRVD